MAEQQRSESLSGSPVPLLLLVALFRLAPGLTDAASCDDPRDVTLTRQNVSYLVNRIQLRFSQISTNDTEGKRYSPLVAGCLRLGFHACAGRRCSSHIDLSDPNNNGLQPIVDIVDKLRATIVQQYPETYGGMSKADFYALCAIAAVEVATDFKGSIVFRYGRPDHCPDDSVEALGVELPSRSIGTADTFAYFRRVFNFSEPETVAIMSAHSVGVMHELATLRPLKRWTSNRPDMYSNEYYGLLINATWQHVSANYSGVPYRLYEWQRKSVPKRFMLNCDISLVREVNVVNVTTGQATCSNYTGCAAYRTASLVRQFSADPKYALRGFLSAYTKMLENGLASSLRAVVP